MKPNYSHLVTMAGRLGALSDDGVAIVRDDLTDDVFVTLRAGRRRRYSTYYFRASVSPDEVADLERDIRDIHERRVAFHAKWGAP